jgi:adenine-specific DNA-methyltransferase
VRPNGTRRQRGAYFTPDWLAREVAQWAIRSASDVVVDPAAGRGDLLQPCVERLRQAGHAGPLPVFGVEIHAGTWKRLTERLGPHVDQSQLICGDFFSSMGILPEVDVVVANPPYVRHHLIGSRARKRMRAAVEAGCTLDGKASAWAYFLAATPQLLKQGGRIAMVLPTEVLSASYSVGLVRYLGQVFERVQLLSIDEDVFDQLQQRAVLCYAEGYCPSGVLPRVEWGRIRVTSRRNGNNTPHRATSLKPLTLGASVVRHFVDADVSALENELAKRTDTAVLGKVAKIRIGYVTGDNGFFHFTERERVEAGISRWDVQRVLARSRDSRGVMFDDDQWEQLRADDVECWLLTPRQHHTDAVRKLLARGRRAGVANGHKCAHRHPWWRVPTGVPPVAFMRYMGDSIGIIANKANVLVSNSLFEIRHLSGVNAGALAAASLTSAFQVSAMLNARVLGGGLRKLEPSDASQLLVPLVTRVPAGLLSKLDRFAKDAMPNEARELADYEILRRRMGWPRRVVKSLQRARELLDRHLS